MGQARRDPGALVEVLLYDFGAVSVSYRIPLEGAGFARLLDLSKALYDNPDLLADSRRRVEQLLDTLRGAIERPAPAESDEDYVIFEIEAWEPAVGGHGARSLGRRVPRWVMPPWRGFPGEVGAER